MPNFYLVSGIVSGLFSIYSFAKHYTNTGDNLISSEKAKEMLINKNIDLVIDIRTKLEYNLGHYPNAINIPVTSISKDSTKDINKNQHILVYCNTGQRARKASEMLNKLGFNNVYYIAGTYRSIK